MKESKNIKIKKILQTNANKETKFIFIKNHKLTIPFKSLPNSKGKK